MALPVCILFHPDYDRRLWRLTRSADQLSSDGESCARGLAGQYLHTAGGEFHPALRIVQRCQSGARSAIGKVTQAPEDPMHPNPIFHDADVHKNLEFARARGFGMLAVNGPDAPMLSHVPFLLGADGAVADLHLVRSNPIARGLGDPVRAKIAVSGPDSYISPDWYGVADQVPTWNYVAVHLTGTLSRLPQLEMRAMLDRQSAAYEDRLRPKPPWTTGKMTPDVLEKMMRMIVPCRFEVESVKGTWKLSQNKPGDVRRRAADAVGISGFGSEVAAMSALMQID